MEHGFYATFDEGKGIVIGVSGSPSEPFLWFKTVNDFDRFLNMLKKFRGTMVSVPDVFLKAFEELPPQSGI